MLDIIDLAFADKPGNPLVVRCRIWLSPPTSRDLPPPVLWAHVELTWKAGRYKTTELTLWGDIDSQSLRQVPLGRIEGIFNAASIDDLYAMIDRLVAIADPDERSFAFKYWFKHLQELAGGEPLKRPDGTDPDGFARRVAAKYSALVASGNSSPAVAIAEEADVPVTTVHRWIADARRRGHLPRGRQGRAGFSQDVDMVRRTIARRRGRSSANPDIVLSDLGFRLPGDPQELAKIFRTLRALNPDSRQWEEELIRVLKRLRDATPPGPQSAPDAASPDSAPRATRQRRRA